MEVTGKDLFYSIILHVGLIMMLSVLNPFSVLVKPDFEAVAVNIISLPPMGDPAKIVEEMPEITIPQATFEEEAAIPVSPPESVTEEKELEKPVEKEKPKPKPRRDEGYQGNAEKGETTQKGGSDVSDMLGPGSPFGSATVDNANFRYPYWFNQSFGKINRNWSNPVQANQPLSCFIYFEVLRSGTVLDPIIETSSGIPAYDRACLRAVQAVSLPPLPNDFRDDIIGIRLEFHYQPR